MKPIVFPTETRRALLRIIGLGLGLASFAAFAEERSSTLVQPPAPPGLPKPPAIRLANPPSAPTPPSVGNGIRIEKEPPVAKEEPAPVVTERPFPEAVWVPGFWIWHGGEYVWVPGKWERPPEGRSVWAAPRWEKRDGGYVFIEGIWK